MAVQGTPSHFSDREFKYGLSAVYFTDGIVTGWDISPLNPIKARLLPASSIRPARSFFTVGSTRDDVLAIQGTPTEFSDRVFKYGLSAVYFSSGAVTSWDISPLNPIKARLLPTGSVTAPRSHFTVGSLKDEVLAIHGTPTEFNDRVWKYGLSSVYFRNGRVVSWDISPLNPLRARLDSSGER